MNELTKFMETRGYRPIQMRRNAIGQLEVDARLDSRAVRMLIDTGASGMVIDRRSADELGLDLSQGASEKAQSAGASIAATMIEIGMVQIDTFEAGPARAAVINLDHCNDALEKNGAPRIDGIIGADFLNSHSAVIQFEHSIMYLRH